VATSPSAGTSGLSLRTSASGETPSFAATHTSSSRPGLPKSAWAVGMSKIANVSSPIESRSLNSARPEIV
jgi:hypothetical protein